VLTELRGQIQIVDFLTPEPPSTPRLLRSRPVQRRPEIPCLAQVHESCRYPVVLNMIEIPDQRQPREIPDLLRGLPDGSSPRIFPEMSVTAGHPPRPVVPLLKKETVFPVLVLRPDQQPRDDVLVLLHLDDLLHVLTAERQLFNRLRRHKINAGRSGHTPAIRMERTAET